MPVSITVHQIVEKKIAAFFILHDYEQLRLMYVEKYSDFVFFAWNRQHSVAIHNNW